VLRRRMRPASILSEAYRNIATGTAATLVLASLLATICAGLVITDARAIDDLRAQARRFHQADASVRTLNAEGRIDPVACDDLAHGGAVRTAGALAPAAPVTLLAAPANAIPGFRVTPGFGGVLGVRAVSATGVWISEELATTLGAAPGGRLATSTGELTIAGVFAWPEDGRDMRLGYAVLQPVPPSPAPMDECWADVWPSNPAADDLILAATFVRPGASDPLMIGQANNSLGAAPDYPATFLARPTRHALPGCLVVGMALGFVAVRRRRLEYAAARHSGQRPMAQAATALLEISVWALAGLVACATALAFVTTAPADGSRAVFLIDLAGPVIAVPGSLLGALLALAMVREDQLFSYFQNR
jgi:hypothetical protein